MTTQHDPQFSAREFLKRRRPHRYSDSTASETLSVDRSLLEFHLDTLTSRNQERDFEIFARHLCAKVICPNLLGQTGPTGGGDSHVDSETYPVAEGLTLSWTVGTPTKAADERWGFAFSAKKTWRPKLKSDIAKIAATGRGYTKAFFVTNQSVRDKARSKVEDQLRAEHGLDVHVLDRTWILNSIFEYDLQHLALEDLKLSANIRRSVRTGPNDLRREQRLQELEGQIQAAIQDRDLTPRLVDDCLTAAELARGLDWSRKRLLPLFERAERIAEQVGTRRQRVEVAYQWAWTLLYWFDVTARLTRQREKRAFSGATRISVAKFVGGEVQWSGAASASGHFPGEQELAAA